MSLLFQVSFFQQLPWRTSAILWYLCCNRRQSQWELFLSRLRWTELWSRKELSGTLISLDGLLCCFSHDLSEFTWALLSTSRPGWDRKVTLNGTFSLIPLNAVTSTSLKRQTARMRLTHRLVTIGKFINQTRQMMPLISCRIIIIPSTQALCRVHVSTAPTILLGW